MHTKESMMIGLREICEVNGTSVAEWARARGFAPALVYRVLRGETKARRGQTHEIAVALGLKRPPTQEEVGLLQALSQVNLENQQAGETAM